MIIDTHCIGYGCLIHDSDLESIMIGRKNRCMNEKKILRSELQLGEFILIFEEVVSDVPII